MPVYLTRPIWIGIDILIILTLIIAFYRFFRNKKLIIEMEKKESNSDCKISEELKKLEEYYNTSCNSYTEKHKLIKLIGTTLGDFNAHFIEKLYSNCNITFPNSTVFESIKYLANNNHYNKDVINDLYPDYSETYVEIMENNNKLNPYNMFLTKYEIFDEADEKLEQIKKFYNKGKLTESERYQNVIK